MEHLGSLNPGISAFFFDGDRETVVSQSKFPFNFGDSDWSDRLETVTLWQLAPKINLGARGSNTSERRLDARG